MASKIEIDIITIFLAAVLNMGLGMVWYSPKVFGQKWMKLIGLTKSKMPKEMGFIYSMAFFASLVTAFALELFIANIPGSNAWTGLMVGFWAGIGFAAASSLSDYLFAGDPKKNELYLINAGFHTIAFMLMGFLLGI